MFCIFAVLSVLVGVISVFLMNWPWWWADKRTIAKHMAEEGDNLLEMKRQWWAKWERVASWTWVPVREYTVLYADQRGCRHKSTARFYLPWWLNKLYDPHLVGNFDLVESDLPELEK